MGKECLISVVVASYNGAKFIERQLDSILNQNNKDVDEIVVVDDCSTDETVKIVNSYSNRGVRLFENKVNLGVVKTFNKGLELARGEYIFLADQDDVWHPDKVYKMFSRIKKMEYTHGSGNPFLLVHDTRILNGEGEVIANSFWNYRGYHPGKETLLSTFIGNTFTGCCMFFNKKLKELVIPIPDVSIYHDHWIGIVAQNNYCVETMDVCLMDWIRHGNNCTVTQSKASYFKRIIRFLNNCVDEKYMADVFITIEIFKNRYKCNDEVEDKLLTNIYNMRHNIALVKRLKMFFLTKKYKKFFSK